MLYATVAKLSVAKLNWALPTSSEVETIFIHALY